MLSTMEQVEPLPLVPATWMTLSLGSSSCRPRRWKEAGERGVTDSPAQCKHRTAQRGYLEVHFHQLKCVTPVLAVCPLPPGYQGAEGLEPSLILWSGARHGARALVAGQ